ncbi:TPA: hypothetical protein QIW90_002713 [Klebsiella variicola]|uniref:hypothetical protein n=1 Tax=Klebsiella TaxID=570 RepID=UPI00063C891C|nr:MULTISPECIES: hypothetical protein [Klebsiella]KLF72745.1 hypothetical protein YA38_07705 [Klebsiella aerogenes]KMG90326.1 hypothetical protein SM62_05159 [Klebsiella variicola]PXK67002.1 hypothetical protein DMS23_24625 [Klebsiella variicola]SSN02371.1 Uncharacterised protein [Klebsiella variicola]STW99467.1 Uncharacterised protein [Klebsiella variicola]
MTPKQFVYWLQGFAELGDDRPTEAQWASIKDHLQTVFEEMAPPAHVSNIGMALHRTEENITSLS